MALVVFLAPVACAQQITETREFPFPDDMINATVTVNFEGYNITAPFSNSSKATVPWQARLDVRANVAQDEVEGFVSPQDEPDSIPYMAMAQIKLAYATEDGEDLEGVDESWGYCAAVQPLFNVTINATESVDPTCRGILEPQCLEFLHSYVDSSDFCESPRDAFVYQDIDDSPWCQGQYFPHPKSPWDVPEWAGRTNLTWDEMQWHYRSEDFDNAEDIEHYDDMATRVFVLLASWGEKNESEGGSINNGAFLNGTVICLRANETTPGSRSMQEVLEDDASMLGGHGAFSVLVIASVAMIAVAF